MATDMQTASAPEDPISIAGVGFFSREFYSNVSSYFDQIDEQYPDRIDPNDTYRRNSAKCDILAALFENGIVDSVVSGIERACPPLFDRASCFPATPAGILRIIPCMESYKGVEYDTTGKINTFVFVFKKSLQK